MKLPSFKGKPAAKPEILVDDGSGGFKKVDPNASADQVAKQLTAALVQESKSPATTPAAAGPSQGQQTSEWIAGKLSDATGQLNDKAIIVRAAHDAEESKILIPLPADNDQLRAIATDLQTRHIPIPDNKKQPFASGLVVSADIITKKVPNAGELDDKNLLEAFRATCDPAIFPPPVIYKLYDGNDAISNYLVTGLTRKDIEGAAVKILALPEADVGKSIAAEKKAAEDAEAAAKKAAAEKARAEAAATRAAEKSVAAATALAEAKAEAPKKPDTLTQLKEQANIAFGEKAHVTPTTGGYSVFIPDTVIEQRLADETPIFSSENPSRQSLKAKPIAPPAPHEKRVHPHVDAIDRFQKQFHTDSGNDQISMKHESGEGKLPRGFYVTYSLGTSLGGMTGLNFEIERVAALTQSAQEVSQTWTVKPEILKSVDQTESRDKSKGNYPEYYIDHSKPRDPKEVTFQYKSTEEFAKLPAAAGILKWATGAASERIEIKPTKDGKAYTISNLIPPENGSLRNPEEAFRTEQARDTKIDRKMRFFVSEEEMYKTLGIPVAALSRA